MSGSMVRAKTCHQATTAHLLHRVNLPSGNHSTQGRFKTYISRITKSQIASEEKSWILRPRFLLLAFQDSRRF